MTFRRLLFFIVFTTLLLNQSFSQTYEKGTLHYPDSGQKGEKVIKLKGYWQFQYGKFLTAQEMENLPVEDKCYLPPVMNWSDLEFHGKKTPQFGAATYYMKIIIDSATVHSTGDFAFRVGDITSAYMMYVNGKPIMWTGSPATTEANYVPGYYPHIGFFHTNVDTLDVVIHVSNFINPTFSGINRPILFGFEKEVTRAHILATGLTIGVLSLFALLFLFELLVFIVLPKEKSHLIVCLLALFFMTKLLLDGDMTIYHFFPNFSYVMGFRCWMFTLLTFPVLFSLIKLSFPEEMNRVVMFVVHSIFGILVILLFILPLPLLLKYLIPVLYFSLICYIYLLWVITKALIKGRQYALPHFISFSIAMTCMLYDLLSMSNPNRINYVSQFGMGFYLITQTSIILFRFIRAHNLWMKMSKDLEVSNQSLETTVQIRTSELQQMNLKLEQMNHQKSFMLATTTHDLKNSFNILINCSGILAEDQTLTKEQLIYAEMIQEATKNGYRVLENILSWAKMEITDYSSAAIIRDLKGYMEEIASSYHNQLEEKKINLKLNLKPNLYFRCDEEHLLSIGRNLFSNAIKFSQPGGEISISTKRIDETVELCFHDNGIGIKPEMVDTLFDNTTMNKRRGTSGESGSGLGLIIVKELVERNNGTVSCVSIPGEGTDFMVRFPRVPV